MFVVGSKLLGIYFLYGALTTLPPSIVMAMSTISASGRYYQGLSSIVILIASAFSGLVMIAFAYALLFKTELIADKLNVSGVPQPSARCEDYLQHGITLIGIYIFATKIGGLAKVFLAGQRVSRVGDPFAAAPAGCHPICS
jgi:hypothetical protein